MRIDYRSNWRMFGSLVLALVAYSLGPEVVAQGAIARSAGLREIPASMSVVRSAPPTPQSADGNGNPIADTVTFSISSAPNTGGATATFVPNPQQTFVPTTLTIATTLTTSPGRYTMTVGGNGPVCGSYGTLQLVLDVAPVESGEQTMWWFNGETPADYVVKTTLTAASPGFGPYTWTISGGGSEAEFSNGSQSIVTNENTVEIRSKGASVNKNSVKLKVNAKGVDSKRFTMTVLAPNSLRALRNVDRVDAMFGYLSEIHYKILDQFGRVLPSNVPLNEQFTSGIVNDFPGTNWPRGPEGGAIVGPADWADLFRVHRAMSRAQLQPNSAAG